ncbi:MAG: alpha/beta hydrolase [Sulfuricella sp.]
MSSRNNTQALGAGAVASMLLLMWQVSFAGPLRDRILERRAGQEQRNAAAPRDSASLPAGMRVERDIPYGSDAQQRFDVYAPAQAEGAPVIFMVHGGAWSMGDKAAQAVVENKVARWVPMGFIVVSANYRLLPKADPVEQARDVARALAAVQDKAASWGGDRTRFILMGHSAGAHLVSLLATTPSISSGLGSTPWLGTVSLDSAALDVVKIMERRHARFYDRAFGNDPKYLRSASPFYALAGAGRPMLLVCSTRRDDSCSQARPFVAKAASLGTSASVLEQDLSHQDINQRLGMEGSYTAAVESFMASLDESVAKALNKGKTQR